MRTTTMQQEQEQSTLRGRTIQHLNFVRFIGNDRERRVIGRLEVETKGGIKLPMKELVRNRNSMWVAKVNDGERDILAIVHVDSAKNVYFYRFVFDCIIEHDNTTVTAVNAFTVYRRDQCTNFDTDKDFERRATAVYCTLNERDDPYYFMNLDLIQLCAGIRRFASHYRCFHDEDQVLGLGLEDDIHEWTNDLKRQDRSQTVNSVLWVIMIIVVILVFLN